MKLASENPMFYDGGLEILHAPAVGHNHVQLQLQLQLYLNLIILLFTSINLNLIIMVCYGFVGH